MDWQPIETAPQDRPVWVWFDHDADPYHDPQNPTMLTDYACHAESGDFLAGRGMAVAHWCEGYHADEGWESGVSYWMPAVWCAWFNGDFADHVCNALYWMELPDEPAQAIEARRVETQSGSVHESAVPTGDASDSDGHEPILTSRPE